MADVSIANLLISMLTIIGSVGSAVFVSGRMIGRVETTLKEHAGKLKQTATDVSSLRSDFERSLNNGIRKDISEIRQEIAQVNERIEGLTRADNDFKEVCGKVHDMSDDVSFIRGVMSQLHPPKVVTKLTNTTRKLSEYEE